MLHKLRFSAVMAFVMVLVSLLVSLFAPSIIMLFQFLSLIAIGRGMDACFRYHREAGEKIIPFR